MGDFPTPPSWVFSRLGNGANGQTPGKPLRNPPPKQTGPPPPPWWGGALKALGLISICIQVIWRTGCRIYCRTLVLLNNGDLCRELGPCTHRSVGVGWRTCSQLHGPCSVVAPEEVQRPRLPPQAADLRWPQQEDQSPQRGEPLVPKYVRTSLLQASREEGASSLWRGTNERHPLITGPPARDFGQGRKPGPPIPALLLRFQGLWV